jgi:hypothetical protein
VPEIRSRCLPTKDTRDTAEDQIVLGFVATDDAADGFGAELDADVTTIGHKITA